MVPSKQNNFILTPSSSHSCFFIGKLSKNLHCTRFAHFHLCKDGFFFASFLCLCVFVLLLVKVVLFSLNWNTSIVYNFYSYLSPCRCLLHTYFACVLPTCLLCTCSTYLLHVANLLPTIYFASSIYAYFCPLTYFHHHHLLASTPSFKYQTPTCLHSCLPTLSFKLALLLGTSPSLICTRGGA